MRCSLLLLWLAVAAAGCKGEAPSQPGAEPAPVADEPAEAPPVDPALVPSDALAALDEAGAPALADDCPGVAERLAPLTAAVASARSELTSRGTQAAPAILDQLGQRIAAAVDDLAAPADGGELARTHDELAAAWRDLGAASAALAQALRAGDADEAGALRRRIDNGVDNLAVTTERMTLLCAE